MWRVKQFIYLFISWNMPILWRMNEWMAAADCNIFIYLHEYFNMSISMITIAAVIPLKNIAVTIIVVTIAVAAAASQRAVILSVS